MESRKVQRAGYSSLSVSLPIDWTKEVGLKPGDLIFLHREEDGSLKIRVNDTTSSKTEAGDEVIVYSELCSEPNMLERIIVGNYLNGHDTLRIVSSKRIRSEHLREIREITRKMIGISIIEEGKNQIILQCSIDPSKFQSDMLLRRLSLIATTMLEEAVQAITDTDAVLAEDAIYREYEANALYWLIVRLLNSAQTYPAITEKIRLSGAWEIPEYRVISKCIEKVADCAENIAKRAVIVVKNKNIVSTYNDEIINKLTNFSKLTCDLFKTSIDCVFSSDIKVGSNALEMRNTIEEEEDKLLSSEVPPHFGSIITCLSRIAENSATIAAIAINRALEKSNKICKPYTDSSLH